MTAFLEEQPDKERRDGGKGEAKGVESVRDGEVDLGERIIRLCAHTTCCTRLGAFYIGVVGVLDRVETEPVRLVDDPGDVEGLPVVVVDGVALDGEIGRVPRVGVVEGRRDYVYPEDQRCKHVQDGPCGHDKRRPDVRNLTPCSQ
ncbi:hypothetical protein CH063_15650 [Colletotrichum higginsianum]|uniref:Uncharacterized protein n=1 Tax=Colletotrichum higginsianum (strain IMI 349063) TaxID=759273 RepID=H1W3T6_COLHI|nr:hypothetical protein CH063_15650 [Colletotrichum higginsianum]